MDQTKTLEIPRKMFFEGRWILISRIYGKEFCKKLFYRVLEWQVRATSTKKRGLNLSRDDKTLKTCELVSQAFVEIAGRFEDPLVVLNEVAQASRITGDIC